MVTPQDIDNGELINSNDLDCHGQVVRFSFVEMVIARLFYGANVTSTFQSMPKYFLGITACRNRPINFIMFNLIHHPAISEHLYF